MSERIYLDNSATTLIRKEALEKYNEISISCYGNPSSLHEMGVLAERELKAARETLRKTLGAPDSTVVFTASGSEANNLAIIGRAYSKDRYRRTHARIITTEGEHASVNAPLDRLRAEGFTVDKLRTVGGVIDMGELEGMLGEDVILLSIMMVNNETGALYDIAEISRILKRRAPNALLHVDATQSYMKLPFTKRSLGADMITVSSHKIEGPKGVGALIIDPRIIKERGISPVILGGGQEGGLRSGPENVPAVAAFAEAARLAHAELNESFERVEGLRDYLIRRLAEDGRLSGISPTLPSRHAPHILNITLPAIKSETMLHYLSSLGIYVSSGSACSSNSTHKTSALTAYGRSEADADHSIRISLSKRNTEADIDALIEGLASGIARLARVK